MQDSTEYLLEFRGFLHELAVDLLGLVVEIPIEQAQPVPCLSGFPATVGDVLDERLLARGIVRMEVGGTYLT